MTAKTIRSIPKKDDPDWIPIDQVRDVVLAELRAKGWSYRRLALEMGYMRWENRRIDNGRVRCARHYPDASEVLRLLGLKKGKTHGTNRRMHYDVALQFAKALNLDPWEIGL